jgi:hypothetical protein
MSEWFVRPTRVDTTEKPSILRAYLERLREIAPGFPVFRLRSEGRR